MKDKIFYSTLLAILHSFVFAQETIRYVYLLDSETKDGIPHAIAHIQPQGLAFQSDLSGLVKIASKQDFEQVQFSHISFEDTFVEELRAFDTVFLNKKSYILPTMDLHEYSAMDYIKRAIKSIPSNFPTSDYFIEGNYIQVHYENGIGVRYLEAEVLVKEQAIASGFKVQQEGFNILNLRKSYVYEQNGEQHGDHLVELFQENPVQYLNQHFLNEKNLAAYDWNIGSKINDSVTISFSNKPWHYPKNIRGEVVIVGEQNQILSIVSTEVSNPSYTSEYREDWMFISSRFKISFAHIDGQYTIDHIAKSYTHQVRDQNNPAFIRYEVSEEFYWKSHSSFIKDKANRTLSWTSNLYSKTMPYSNNDWVSNFHLERIRPDLEHKHPLSYQFSNP